MVDCFLNAATGGSDFYPVLDFRKMVDRFAVVLQIRIYLKYDQFYFRRIVRKLDLEL